MRTYHLVDCLNNLQHLLITNLAVSIDVIQLERPFELVLHLPTTRHTQSAYELLEFNRAIVIGIKDPENIICKRCWITVWKELTIYILKFGFGEKSRRAILDEAYQTLSVSVPCHATSGL